MAKINRDFGRRPELHDDRKKDYGDMMRDVTEVAMRGRGLTWRHSEFKKPYAEDEYEVMERLHTPSQPWRYGPSLPDSPKVEEAEWPCWCLGTRGFPVNLDRIVDCQAVTFSTVLVCGSGEVQVSGVADDMVSMTCTNMNIPHVGWVASDILHHSYTSDAPFPSPPCTEIISQCCQCVVTITPDCETGFDCNGERIITVVEPNGNVYELTIGGIDCTDITVSGSDTATQGSSAQYTVASKCSTGLWSIAGTYNGDAATINQAGLVSVNDACTYTVTYADECGNSNSLTARVTDNGQWANETLISDCNCLDEPCFNSCGVECEVFIGKYKYVDKWQNIIGGKVLGDCTGEPSHCSATCGDGTNMQFAHAYRYEWVC